MSVTSCTECGHPADAMLCPACTQRLARALADLPSLLSALSGVVTRQARLQRSQTQERIDEDWRGAEYALIRTPWPVNIDAADELARVGNELAGWVRHLCESRGIEPSREIRCARWLLAHVDAIMCDEAAGEILTEVEALRADLARAVDNSPALFYAGPCHAEVEEPVAVIRAGVVLVSVVRRRCERDLYARVNPWGAASDHTRRIVCRGWRSAEDGCGTAHTVAARQVWLLDSVADALLPLETWRRSLPSMVDGLVWPHRSTWLRWADPATRSDRLLPRGVDRDGRELFRGGDLLDVVRADQGRIKVRGTVRRIAC